MEFTRQGIYDLLGSYPISVLCKRFGLSDNGLRRFLEMLDIPTPPPGYWAKIAAGKKAERKPLPKENEYYVEAYAKILVDLRKKFQGELYYDICHLLGSDTDIKEIQEITNSLPQHILNVSEPFVPKQQLVLTMIEFYRLVKSDYDRNNTYSNKEISRLNVSVSDGLLKRALNIFQTVIHAVEFLGFSVSVSDGNTFVVFNNSKVNVRMTEINTRIKNLKDKYPTTELVPSGKLRFEITGRYSFESTKIEDTAASKLEDKIAEIITKILYHRVKEIARQEQLDSCHEANDKKKAEEIQEEGRRELKKQLRKNELRHLSDIIRGANRLHLANLLREYLAVLEQNYSKIDEVADRQHKEAAWLKKKIDWIDPWINADDDILLDEDIPTLLDDIFRVVQPLRNESKPYSPSISYTSRWYPGKKWYMN